LFGNITEVFRFQRMQSPRAIFQQQQAPVVGLRKDAANNFVAAVLAVTSFTDTDGS
jgi:hypothetical protein